MLIWLFFAIKLSISKSDDFISLYPSKNKKKNVFKFRLFGTVETLYTYACFLATKRQP